MNYIFTRDKKKVFKEVIFFLAKTEQKEVKVSFEHKDFLWLPYEEALQKLTYDTAKDLLKKAKTFLDNQLSVEQ